MVKPFLISANLLCSVIVSSIHSFDFIIVAILSTNLDTLKMRPASKARSTIIIIIKTIRRLTVCGRFDAWNRIGSQNFNWCGQSQMILSALRNRNRQCWPSSGITCGYLQTVLCADYIYSRLYGAPRNDAQQLIPSFVPAYSGAHNSVFPTDMEIFSIVRKMPGMSRKLAAHKKALTGSSTNAPHHNLLKYISWVWLHAFKFDEVAKSGNTFLNPLPPCRPGTENLF